MCGIGGFLGDWQPPTLDVIQKLLRHRGPDDSGVYYDEEARIGLAHTRLSIVDLAGGRQPLTNEDGTIVVVFNGEIYNHQLLRRELESKGHHLASGSDGEVIAHLYEEEGIDFVKRLRGMFAIALWDSNRRKLYLIRDRFGIKPLYLAQARNGLIFASEAKAIIAAGYKPELDPQALRWYLTFRFVPEEHTMFRGIRKVLPAHWVEVSESGVRSQRYWDLRQTEVVRGRSEEDWRNGLREHLEEAVRVRLMSDVPLGAFLSGGLDSSAIVGLMSGLVDNPVETFSFGVGTGWHNETEYAEIAAAAFQTAHHSLSGDCDDLTVLEKAVFHLDEPLADTAVIPTFLLSELTRRFVTVSLTGEGADELLGGYDKYKVLTMADRLGGLVPRSLCDGLARAASFWEKGRRGFSMLAESGDRARAYCALTSVFDDHEQEHLLSGDTAASFKGLEPASEVVRRVFDGCQGPSYLDDLIHLDLQTWLPNDVLLKADKMTMAHSLEGRVPFLDHHLAEFCASMPAALKLKGWKEKYILRAAMRGIVPDTIIERRKHGFTVPLSPWLAKKGPGNARELLSAEAVRSRGLFSVEAIQSLLRKAPDDLFTRRKLFSVMMLEVWARTFLDGQCDGMLSQ